MAIQLNEENGGKLLARKEAIVSRGVAIEELAGFGHAVRRQDRHLTQKS